MNANAYYLDLGDGRYRPTEHTQGAWRETEQHMAPVSGLLAHAIETHAPRPDLQLCRLTYEILGVIEAADFEIAVEVIRPGRTIELVEATLTIGDRPAVRATAWRLAVSDTAEVAGGEPTPLPGPDGVPPWDVASRWGGGFIDGLEFRVLPGSEPGRARAWLRTGTHLVDGVAVSELAGFIGLLDTANGIAGRLPPTEWLYPNTDLSIHLFRAPRFTAGDGWVGFDAQAVTGPTGIGLTTATVYDLDGPVGRTEQILTVRRLPPR